MTVLPDGKRDVTVLVNEQEVIEDTVSTLEPETPEESLEHEMPLEEIPEESLEPEIPPEEPLAPDSDSEPTPEVQPTNTIYQYDGNQFRTVYELTEEEVLANLDKYLNYDSSNEPTLEQIAHDHELIDSFTMELMEGGLL